MLASVSRTVAADRANDRRDGIVIVPDNQALSNPPDCGLALLPAAGLMSAAPLSLQALMWEWQRRDPAFAEFAAHAPPPLASTQGTVTCLRITPEHDASDWGCLFAECADMPAAIARLFWTAERDPFILSVTARPVPAGTESSLDIMRLAERVILLSDDQGREQLLVGSAASSLRLDICDGTLGDGPVALTYHVPGFGAAEPRLRTIALLHHLQRYLCLPAVDMVTPQTWRRDVSRLVAFDALSRGASHREIAALIFGQAAVDDDWDDHTDRVRSSVRRIIRDAKRLANGDYKKMLL